MAAASKRPVQSSDSEIQLVTAALDSERAKNAELTRTNQARDTALHKVLNELADATSALSRAQDDSKVKEMTIARLQAQLDVNNELKEVIEKKLNDRAVEMRALTERCNAAERRATETDNELRAWRASHQMAEVERDTLANIGEMQAQTKNAIAKMEEYM